MNTTNHEGDRSRPSAVASPGPVRRLHVLWRKGQWSIESERHIPSMTLMRSQPLPATSHAAHTRGVSGFWYEAVDVQGQVLYRQTMADPFDAGVESFDDHGQELIRRLGVVLERCCYIERHTA